MDEISLSVQWDPLYDFSQLAAQPCLLLDSDLVCLRAHKKKKEEEEERKKKKTYHVWYADMGPVMHTAVPLGLIIVKDR